MSAVNLYHQMYRIRRFEETVLENFPKGVFFGTTHTYIGQEANAVGVLNWLQPDDIVVSNHRCHGHFLAYGGEMAALFAELMGKPDGVCAGRGGSQHLHWRNFYSNGIQGGIAPLAAGMALAEKRKSSRALTVCFIGDGTLGEGALYETLNMAALWRVPLLFVVEDNAIAQTTPSRLAMAGYPAERFGAFGIPSSVLDTSDVSRILESAGTVFRQVRDTQTPYGLILKTCRFGPHSKGDDTRPPDEVAAFKQTRDPLTIHGARLSDSQRAEVHRRVDAEVENAFQQAMQAPAARPAAPKGALLPPPVEADRLPPQPTVLRSLNAGLRAALQNHPQTLLLGEDLLDPYGGAFKVTQSLSTDFPEQVLTTPISEAAIAGFSGGLALRGLRPVAEIMFGDFVTLIADQVINHIAKFRWMYNDRVRVPLVIRAPMGGRRGYGPTHSQTLEKLFLGVPGLRVVAVCALGNPGALLLNAIADEEPVFFVENKLLYLEEVQSAGSLTEFDVKVSAGAYPSFSLKIKDAPPPEMTIAAYGYMAEMARQAALELAYRHEIFTEVVTPTQLAPLDDGAVLASLGGTGRLLTVEEGTLPLGWGAELVARASEKLGGRLRAAGRVGARDLPVPSSGPLESVVLPQLEDIVQTAIALQKRI